MPSKEFKTETWNEVTFLTLPNNRVVNQDEISRQLGNREKRWNKKQTPNPNQRGMLKKRWGNAQDKADVFRNVY